MTIKPKSSLCVALSVFMLSCANEPVEKPIVNEDKAWAELLANVEALGAEYGNDDATRNLQNPARDKEVAQMAVLGAMATGSTEGNFTMEAGALAATYFTARDRRVFSKYDFSSADVHNAPLNSYITLVNGDEFDAYGLMYNKALVNMVMTNGTANLGKLTDDQAYSAITNAVRKANNNFLPPTHNPTTHMMAMMRARNMANYADVNEAIDVLVKTFPSVNTIAPVVRSYISLLSTVSDAKLVEFHNSFRSIIASSDVSSNAKFNLRILISIGLASSGNWIPA